MASLSKFFTHIYTLTIVFFTLLIFELIILIRSIANSFSGDHPITTAQYLKLIEKKNPSSRFRSGRAGSRECTVCLSVFEEGEEIRRLRCGHVFHKECLDTWLKGEWATCPLCRSDVLPEEIVVKYRRRRRNEQREEYDGSDEELVFLLSSFHGNYLRRFL
ncbi:hypothetical protein LguiA_013601 [Lonicera macranthoides]